MRPRLWLPILIAMTVLVAVLGWQLAHRGTTSIMRGSPHAPPVAAVTEATVPPPLAVVADAPADASPARQQMPAVSGTRPAASRKPASGLELTHIDGFALVRLGGGAPAIRPYGGRGHDPTRTIRGRVVDADGAPVPGAIVLADQGMNIERDTVMTRGDAVSGSDGAFVIANAPVEPCVVLALVGEDWSSIASVPPGSRDLVELRVIGHGSLAVHLSYDGGPETFTVHVATADRQLVGRYQTGSDGALTIRSLPPGPYVVDGSLAQGFGGSVSRSASKPVTVTRAKTTEVELELARGTTVEVTAVPPSDSTPKGITYWLFTGTAPRDGVDATARKETDKAPSKTVGGGIANDAVEFHDIAPGSYWACAGFFDLATMGAFARPFGCTSLVVREGEEARDVTVPLS